MHVSEKRSIAIITFLCPYPVSDGGRFGVFSFVNDMRKLFDVTVVFKVPKSEEENVTELKKLWPDVEVLPIYTKNSFKSNAVKQKESLFKKLVLPIRMLKYKKRAKKENFQTKIVHSLYPFTPEGRELLDFLDQLFRRKKFDIVQVEYSDLLNLVHIIPEGAKKVFFQHENRYSILEDYFAVNKDNGLYASYIVNTARFTEINLMNQYDRILILNRNDQARLAEYIPLKKLQFMPTSVPESLVPNCKPTASAEKLVFMGSQGHHPNMDAVQWFSEEMLEKAIKQTGLELYVTGKWKDVFRHQHPRIHFTGFVDDIGEVLQGGILIAPIRLGGGGIRIKILQAMACGVPVIATSLITNGMEGIMHGENIFIADTADDFIDAIKVLSSDNSIYAEVSKNGMTLIDRYYSEKAAIKTKEKIFEELLNE